MSYQNYSLCPVYTNLSGSSLLYFREKKMLYKINIKQNINKIYLSFINDHFLSFLVSLDHSESQTSCSTKELVRIRVYHLYQQQSDEILHFLIFKISSNAIYFFYNRITVCVRID